jgi:hypothetical protein
MPNSYAPHGYMSAAKASKAVHREPETDCSSMSLSGYLEDLQEQEIVRFIKDEVKRTRTLVPRFHEYY